MYFIDVSTGMATLKTGGASAVVPQGTKLMLPHEMLTANGTAQSVIGATASPLSSGHSTTTTLLISNNHHFYHHQSSSSFHNNSSSSSSSPLHHHHHHLFNSNSNSISNSSNSSHDINSHSHLRSNSITALATTPSLITNNTFFTQNHSSTQPSSNTTTVAAATTTSSLSSGGTPNQNYLISNNNHRNIISATNATTSSSVVMSTMNTTATANTTTTTTTPKTEVKQEEILKENEENNTETSNTVVAESTEPVEEDPEIDIVINNVVCSFSVRCHLNLRTIALNGYNVEFRRENGMVTMKLRKPYTTASIWSSGKITCTGATSEDNAKVAARRYARMLQKLGFRVRFNNFRVVNVLGTCSMPWAIKITQFSERYRKEASYEPELHPGVTYKLKEPKATLKIFSTGSITVTAASVSFVQQAIEHIYPLVYEFRKKRTPDEEKKVKAHLHDPTVFDPNDLIEVDPDFDEESFTAMQPPPKKQRRPAGKAINDPNEDIMQVSDAEIDGVESDDDLYSL
uniref:TATA box-binding protein-like 1 n=1 Tax=Culicoides sonorensis TaxID=179676 RepID=A0A336M385_CULSO